MRPKLKQLLWQWRGVLLAVPNVTVIVIILRLMGLLEFLELTALDQFFLLRPQQPVDERIIIVEINESNIRKLKGWPINDNVLARVLNNIKQQKPLAIGLDIYRDLPLNPGHQNLVNIFNTTPNLIGVEKLSNTSDSSAVKPPPELKKLNQVGANDFPLDKDGKIRRALLYAGLPDGNNLESFGLKLALLYLKPQGITEKPSENNPNFLQLGKGIFPNFESNDGGYLRADDSSYQIILNYRGGIDRFTRVSINDVLDNRISPDLMRGKIVLVGATAESLNDLFWTPYSSKLIGAPVRMAGVAIHANLISQILSSALESRPQIKTLAEPIEWLWILFWSMVGASLCWQHRHVIHENKKFSLTNTTSSIVLATACLVGGSYLAFLFAWWIPIVPPLLALTGSAIAVTQYIARSAAEMRRTFGRYVTDEVVANLLETPSGLKLGGERKKVTVLMSDLRGFSAVSERLPPEQVVAILNVYLGAMADVINHYNGTINEFIGDGIFVMFGAPVSREDDSQRAIACAIAMQLAMKPVNEHNQQMNLPIIEMGIGIHTGEVVAGNVGSQKRAKYSVVGSHVNLTSRIESYTVGGQILISEETLKDANTDPYINIRIDGQLRVEPKGIKAPITIYDIGGIGGKYNLHLPKSDDNMLKLSEEISVEYTILEGKHAVGTIFNGEIVKLSEHGAILRSPNSLDSLSNLKMRLLNAPEIAPGEGDIYAKVLKKAPDDDSYFLIRFTAMPPKPKEVLDNRLKSESSSNKSEQ
ncbi:MULTISPECIES: CHASE2 domain-containing protein [unclassified Tolypothrix]|uniref:CHASE2 domain-containing protein n=1 Tax=unclassified Tolypothrix TaxID=2649714 RepID=UPI0005EAA405|nr:MULTISPECIES: adenylate/guanylate cyclase domain-containing protein [unclassified Tolypothrix]BAY93592.1 adenylate/guanylate cyclase with Chase sensor [Microchaete diplosiphon NIES-3275]EKE99618.1 adenylate cyclase [Tolypothrix sp. PCC 7601]MBE9082415.1 adenylate/guanylate cyclase domain-containing protein [Tolypothrix sp. LEGE 11397]UYD27418.1 adenylate/guanylate cyclase domain-containing protein [Tolypothrix sp. PCC 7712]UYD36717.1 adenylate/guanylate cyclase domain-containing protein [To